MTFLLFISILHIILLLESKSVAGSSRRSLVVASSDESWDGLIHDRNAEVFEAVAFVKTEQHDESQQPQQPQEQHRQLDEHPHVNPQGTHGEGLATVSPERNEQTPGIFDQRTAEVDVERKPATGERDNDDDSDDDDVPAAQKSPLAQGAPQEQHSRLERGETGGTEDSEAHPEWLCGKKEEKWESSWYDDSWDGGWNGWDWSRNASWKPKHGWQDWKGAQWGSDQWGSKKEDEGDEMPDLCAASSDVDALWSEMNGWSVGSEVDDISVDKESDIALIELKLTGLLESSGLTPNPREVKEALTATEQAMEQLAAEAHKNGQINHQSALGVKFRREVPVAERGTTSTEKTSIRAKFANGVWEGLQETRTRSSSYEDTKQIKGEYEAFEVIVDREEGWK